MGFTSEQLKDLLKRNRYITVADAEDNPACKLSNPQPECHQAPALDQAVPREAEGIRRVVVRFIGYRVRPLDPDNFAGSVKDLLDGLRHSGLIKGDEWWRIKLETEQVKVAHYEEEKTVVEVGEI